MRQHLQKDVEQYHALFSADRCSGWELEELIVRAVKADTRAQHQALWREAGHDAEADITVRTNGNRHPIQIKSGKFKKKSGNLELSGHRLGRFKGDFTRICGYLNAPVANIIAVPYRQVNDDTGRRHMYRICYIDSTVLTGLRANEWEKHGAQFHQINSHGVIFSLRPSLSWQIWWQIPGELYESTDEFGA